MAVDRRYTLEEIREQVELAWTRAEKQLFRDFLSKPDQREKIGQMADLLEITKRQLAEEFQTWQK